MQEDMSRQVKLSRKRSKEKQTYNKFTCQSQNIEQLIIIFKEIMDDAKYP